MNLYTIVTNDEYELPVKCDLRVREAAEYLHTTPDCIRRMVCRPPKRARYKPVVTGTVTADRHAYEKKYRMMHDRSEYFRERYRRIKDAKTDDKEQYGCCNPENTVSV